MLSLIHQHCLHNPRAVIIHNHPAKHALTCLPSNCDVISSQLLRWQLAAVGIELTDGIIVSEKKYWSFRDHNLLDNQWVICSGEDLLNFIFCVINQLSFIFPKYSEDIEHFNEEIINLLEKLEEKPKGWKTIFSLKKSPLIPNINYKTNPLLEILASKIRQLDLSKNHVVKYNQVLSFGKSIQTELCGGCYH
ncbi:hypothetical protein N752_09285 [Desulforamulus aquiferis]|nr:JAB domain-containing protein [Desulforamulus aquiferis]RYD05529.1 hypothetical protein N752_09285 [Desulforamulus aquiferis]